MNTKTIAGREVVPLRLLPFASRWLPALTVAQSLAHKNPNDDLELTGYYLNGDKLIPRRPHEWDSLVDRLVILTRELQEDEKSKFEDANRARYYAESLAMLPADIVVDCEELRVAYFKVFLDHESDGPGYLAIRPGDNDLDFNCYLETDDRRVIFECFHAEPIAATKAPESHPVMTSSIDEETNRELPRMVEWKRSLIANWPGIVEKYGDAADARQIMAYLREYDVEGCVVAGPDRRKLYWRSSHDNPSDPVRGVTKKTVGNAKSELKDLLKATLDGHLKTKKLPAEVPA